MMGFTFVVGVAFAYVLKLMIALFSLCNSGERSRLLKNSRLWGRAYRIQITRTYINIHATACGGLLGGILPSTDGRNEASGFMDKLAEYHFGNREESERKDSEMKCLYELHHGEI